MINRYFTIAVLLVAILAVAVGCKTTQSSARSGENERIDALEKSVQRLGMANNDLQNEIAGLRMRNGYLEQENKSLQVYKQQMDAIDQTLEARLKLTMPNIGDSGIETGSNWLRLPEKLLFGAGEASVKDGGKKILDSLADIVKKGEYFVSIEGHTDADPITKSKSRWTTGSNFELGGYRALNVALYLKSKGVSSSKMRIVSWGEFKPIIANDTAKNKERNRRVEIMFSKVAPTTPDEKPLLAPKDEAIAPADDTSTEKPETPVEKPSSGNIIK